MKNIILGIVALLIIGGGIYFLMNQTPDTVVIVDEDEEMMPVEPDGGIGDGAEPLNEVIAQQRGPESSLGTSVDGNDIKAFHFGTGANEVLFVGGVHGSDAPSTAAVAQELVAYLSDNPSVVPADVTVTVIPNLNPDGSALSGTAGRFNANDVDLNRNFPTSDWQSEPVLHRATLDAPGEVALSPGTSPGSEPETQALIGLIRELEPEAVVALHSPLACVDDPNDSELGQWLAVRSGLPLVPDVGYPTPGSFGTWGAEQGLPVVTYEFGLITPDEAVREQVPVLVELLTRPIQP